MPTKSAGQRKRGDAPKSDKPILREAIPMPELEEGELAGSIIEEEVATGDVESELLEEITLDDDELNPFGDKWEQ